MKVSYTVEPAKEQPKLQQRRGCIEPNLFLEVLYHKPDKLKATDIGWSNPPGSPPLRSTLNAYSLQQCRRLVWARLATLSCSSSAHGSEILLSIFLILCSWKLFISLCVFSYILFICRRTVSWYIPNKHLTYSHAHLTMEFIFQSCFTDNKILKSFVSSELIKILKPFRCALCYSTIQRHT